MYKVIEKEILNPTVTKMVVEAPAVAKKALAGQFIILRVHEDGERIPLTIADYDREKGTITIIFQIVGKTTMLLNQLNVGDSILDFVGPLGVKFLGTDTDLCPISEFKSIGKSRRSIHIHCRCIYLILKFQCISIILCNNRFRMPSIIRIDMGDCFIHGRDDFQRNHLI